MPRASNQSELQEYRKNGFVISTDRERLDLDLVHGFLTECYWCEGISREVVSKSIENALCFGIYADRKQIGFARVISDYATYAYLGDVLVLETHRGQGLAKWLMECIMKHPLLQGLRRWSLVTGDAHGLYSQFGFTPLQAPERWMEIHKRDVYAKVPRKVIS
jgi:GNAT superfamily N-acetyltransferase